MQALHIVLFVVVAAFGLTLLGVLLWSRVLRQARPPVSERLEPARDVAEPREAAAEAPRTPASSGLVCPACKRAFALGLKYCPHDARALVPAGDPAVRSMAPGVTCPTCKRSFDSNKKFCPYDAEELVPVALASASARAAGALPRVLGKICPHCAQRYESEATFCGRDGSELVSVN
jgi:predicted amidophosphoribosyltransferase